MVEIGNSFSSGDWAQGIVDVFGEGAFGPSSSMRSFCERVLRSAKDGMLGDLIHEGHENSVDDIYDTCSHQGAEIGMDIENAPASLNAS